MPKKKVASKSKPAPRRTTRSPKSEEIESITLSTRTTVPMTKLGDYSMLIFGEKKIGKTTLAARFPKAHFLMTEPGGKSLRIHKGDIPHWRHFLKYLELFEQDPKGFETIVIDTVDELYNLCFKYMCEEKLLIEHPHDENDYGKSWGKIKEEFTSSMRRLFILPMGCIIISHAEEREINTLSGGKFNRLVPTMAKQANEFLTGIIDIWAYYGYDGQDRYLFCRVMSISVQGVA